MRHCGVCTKPPRYDDSLKHLQLVSHDATPGPSQGILVSALGVSGGVMACRECVAEIEGTPLEVPTYPPGCRMPPRPGGKEDTVLDICGLCRRALREGDVPRSIRLEREDLLDGWWEAYRREMEPARRELEAAAAPAWEDYHWLADPARAKYDQRMARLQAELDQAIEDIVLSANSQEEADRLTDEAAKRREQSARLCEAEYRAAEAVPRLTLEQALARAAFSYRKAGIAASRKLASEFASQQPSAEVGRYLACSECLEKYRPRVVERLKRNGVVKPSMSDEAIHGDWLM